MRDGVRLWCANTGDGPPVVLCHGGPGLWDNLQPVAAMLDDRMTVLRYDQRGGGRSDPAGPYTIERSVADVDELRAFFGWQKWLVAGHSWGASLALCYALAYPEHTRAVVYLSGVGLGQDWNAAYHEEADRRRTDAQQTRLRELVDLPHRSASEEHERRILTWATDFADRDRAVELAAQLRKLERVGHNPWLEAPAQLEATLDEFVRSIDGDG
jgi:proline iminopeptidase